MIALFLFSAVCFWIGITLYYRWLEYRAENNQEPIVAKTWILNLYISIFAAAVFLLAWKYLKKYFLKRGV
jgi:hypothetical protein